MVEYCPITGEPLLGPGQTISHAAINQLINKMKSPGGLVSLMGDVDAALGGQTNRDQGRRATRPTSAPPINLALLDRIDDHRDTIQSWAYTLAQHINPGLRFKHGDWTHAAAIFLQYSPKAQTWELAPMMIDELTDAVKQLQRALKPAQTRRLNETEQQHAATTLHDRWLTITPAIEAVRLITGTTIPASTIRTWKQTGKISTLGDPPQYRVQDLIDQRSTPKCDKITTGEQLTTKTESANQ